MENGIGTAVLTMWCTDVLKPVYWFYIYHIRSLTHQYRFGVKRIFTAFFPTEVIK